MTLRNKLIDLAIEAGDFDLARWAMTARYNEASFNARIAYYTLGGEYA